MKRPFVIFGGGFVLIVGTLIVVGLFLDRKWDVSRSTTVNAKPAAVFELVNEPKTWAGWAGFQPPEGSDVKIEFIGPATGVGSGMKWEGNTIGTGKLTIVESDPNVGIWYEADIEGNDVKGKGSITFKQTDKGLVVTWTDSGQTPPVIGGYFRSTVEASLNEHFDEALGKLKDECEERQAKADKAKPDGPSANKDSGPPPDADAPDGE